jgi:hypothetical protein
MCKQFVCQLKVALFRTRSALSLPTAGLGSLTSCGRQLWPGKKCCAVFRFGKAVRITG